MAIFKGRVRVRDGYSRWGYTRNNGKGWHGGSDEEGLDSTTILMPDYKGKSISGRVITARKVDKSTGSKTWEWGWYVCVELDAGQTPDAVNYLYFCHNARNLVSVGQRVKSGDALAVIDVYKRQNQWIGPRWNARRGWRQGSGSWSAGCANTSGWQKARWSRKRRPDTAGPCGPRRRMCASSWTNTVTFCGGITGESGICLLYTSLEVAKLGLGMKST